MPRYVVVDAFDPDDGLVVERSKAGKALLLGRNKTKTLKPSLDFVDDEWNGILGSAFTKIHVKSEAKHHGMHLPKLGSKKNDDDTIQYVVEKDLQPSPGFDEIVFRMGGGYQACLLLINDDGVEAPTTTGEPRVLIANACNDAAKLGLHRGDVVTHINGNEFTGGTAEDLKHLIKGHYASNTSGNENENENDEANHRLELVVNAEPCIAQALKLRAV